MSEPESPCKQPLEESASTTEQESELSVWEYERFAFWYDDELKHQNIYIATLAEFWGTLFLVLIGCGSTLGDTSVWPGSQNPSFVGIALAFGFVIATMVWCLSHISGGHINPAITLAFLVTGRLSVIRCIFYIVAQCLGACFGSGLLAALTERSAWQTLGRNSVSETLTLAQGFGVELLTTYVFIWTVFACCDKYKKDVNGSWPLTIGVAVVCIHLFSIKYTGTGLNPARSLGPDVILSLWPVLEPCANGTYNCGDILLDPWSGQWVFLAGPILGGICAGIIYEYVYAVKAPQKRSNSWFASLWRKCRNEGCGRSHTETMM